MLEIEPRGKLTAANYVACIPFALCHLICFAAIWTGVEPLHVGVALALYVVRMFGVTGGYHRYFSHRTYKLNRFWQFMMAFLAQSSGQKGVLWWAAHHRHHHRHSDTPDDVHSPRQHGFWYSHLAWILVPGSGGTRYEHIPDLARYPELRWLNKHYWIPPLALALAVFAWLGLPGLIVGFFWSNVLLWHGTFSINSLAHVIGKARYATDDDSKNHFGLALITMGEGWHNNHHFYQAAANQGFFWWEIDITYMILVALSWVGIVRDIKRPPKHVIENRQHPSWERAARAAALREAAFALEKSAGEGTVQVPDFLPVSDSDEVAVAPVVPAPVEAPVAVGV